MKTKNWNQAGWYRIAAVVLLLYFSPLSLGHAGETAPVNAVEKPGWTLTFHDEFDGAQLDATKWDDHYWDGRTHSNNELEYSFPLRPGRLPVRIIPPV